MAIHVFLYDDRTSLDLESADGRDRAAGDSEKVRDAAVRGTLFDVEGVGLTLMLAGSDRVPGEVRRVDAATLEELDARARVRDGLHRRIGLEVGDTPCWTWVAGPALASRLATGRRVRRGEEARP